MGVANRRNTSRKRAAATEDVLSSHRKPIPRKWRQHYDRLVELRDQLLKGKAELTNDALAERPRFSMHMADAGTDAYDRDLALGILSAQQDAIYEVDAALERIRSGRYGVCELTGKPIEKGRLEAIPWTRFTAAAEKQLEMQGRVKSVALGKLETTGHQRKTSRIPI